MAIHDTHDLGHLYWHTMTVPRGTPVLDLAGVSHEVEAPWRVGSCWTLRLPRRRCLVVGWWGPPRTEQEMHEAEARYEVTEEHARRSTAVDTEVIRQNFLAPPREPRSALYDVR